MYPSRKTNGRWRCRQETRAFNPAWIALGAMVAALAVGTSKAEQNAGTNGGHATTPLERIRVSNDKTHFTGAISGRRMLIWGMNYDHDERGRLIEDYWHSEWAKVTADFAEIRALGGNVVRVHLQLAKFMDSAETPNAANLARLRDLIGLAEQTGLYLDLTGLGCYHKQDVPVWYDSLDTQARWNVQANFWRAVAAVGKDHAAIFCYNLMNEPILPGARKEQEWLAGELGGKFFVQRLALDLAGQSQIEMARDWVSKLTGAIRSVDSQGLLTVGVIPWAQVFKGAKPLFYAPEVCGPLDFASVHFYPEKGRLSDSLKALAVYEVGKPLVIEEIYPLRAGFEETEAFINGSREFVDGWISFYWGATIEENRSKGDMAGAIMAKWLEFWRKEALDPDGDQ